MVRLPRFLLLASLAGAVPIGAQAQVNPFLSSSSAGLRSSDFQVMHDAARKLAAQGHPADGTSQAWSNPQTGASGSVTVEGTFHHKAMLCRKVEYRAQSAPGADELSAEVSWCKTPNGWKML